jgi:hypothetical protein
MPELRVVNGRAHDGKRVCVSGARQRRGKAFHGQERSQDASGRGVVREDGGGHPDAHEPGRQPAGPDLRKEGNNSGP